MARYIVPVIELQEHEVIYIVEADSEDEAEEEALNGCNESEMPLRMLGVKSRELNGEVTLDTDEEEG